MWHTVFVTLHAVAGVIAFVAGCLAIRRASWFATYLWSLLVMALALVPSTAIAWPDRDGAGRGLFLALTALAGFMVWRAVLARRMRPVAPGGPSARYVDHVGFTLVALADAFVVVLVLDLGGPAWLIAAVGVAVAIVGHFVLRAIKPRTKRRSWTNGHALIFKAQP